MWMFSVLQMEGELERYHKQNMQLELNIDELRQKLKATEKEMLKERHNVRFFFKTLIIVSNGNIARRD